MQFRSPYFLLFLLVASVPLAATGCGGKSGPAATETELDAYLQANPDEANEDAPEIDAE